MMVMASRVVKLARSHSYRMERSNGIAIISAYFHMEPGRGTMGIIGVQSDTARRKPTSLVAICDRNGDNRGAANHKRRYFGCIVSNTITVTEHISFFRIGAEDGLVILFVDWTSTWDRGGVISASDLALVLLIA